MHALLLQYVCIGRSASHCHAAPPKWCVCSAADSGAPVPTCSVGRVTFVSIHPSHPPVGSLQLQSRINGSPASPVEESTEPTPEPTSATGRALWVVSVHLHSTPCFFLVQWKRRTSESHAEDRVRVAHGFSVVPHTAAFSPSEHKDTRRDAHRSAATLEDHDVSLTNERGTRPPVDSIVTQGMRLAACTRTSQGSLARAPGAPFTAR